MTAVRRFGWGSLLPSAREAPPAVRALTDAELPTVRARLAADPIACAQVQARLDHAGSLAPRRFGGQLLGVFDDEGGLAAFAYSGGSVMPVDGSGQALLALGSFLAKRPRNCTSIVGRHDMVEAMWEPLCHAWSPIRELRSAQPLLVADRLMQGGDIADVRLAELADVETYLEASAAMFAEEIGVSPYRQVTRAAYRRRLAGLVASGRALVLTDDRGVVFKAEFAAVTTKTCQIQGVWVRPSCRGQGIATAAMRAVTTRGLAVAPTVSLYVNDFNEPARRLYARLGMRQIATMSTVLL